MILVSLTGEAARWLQTLRINGRIRAKHMPDDVRCELVRAKLARVAGGNVVITAAGLRDERAPQKSRGAHRPTFH
jgi:hypothetical protein